MPTPPSTTNAPVVVLDDCDSLFKLKLKAVIIPVYVACPFDSMVTPVPTATELPAETVSKYPVLNRLKLAHISYVLS